MISAVRINPYSFELQLRGERSRRLGWWLSIVDEAGQVGRGDAVISPGFGAAHADVEASLHDLAVAIHGLEEERALARFDDEWAAEARYAGELALLDLQARRQGVSMASLLRPNASSRVAVHTLVGDAAGAAAAVSRGARHLKLKLPAGVRAATQLVSNVHQAAPDARLRLDGNCLFSLEETAAIVEELRRQDVLGAVEWLEQPVAGLRDLAAVRSMGVSVAADELVLTTPAAQLCEVVDVVIIKPMYVGGLRAALSLADEMDRIGGPTVCFTHALESPVGRVGAASVAAAWGQGVHGVALTEACVATLKVPANTGRRPSVARAA